MTNQETQETSISPVVKAESLTKVFRDFWHRPKVCAVNSIDFEVFPGEVFGLLGPNGSGKSTTLKMILGLLYPTGGRVRVFGESPCHVRSKARIGYLPEETNLYKYLTAQEILDFYGRMFDISGIERRNRINQLLDMAGLPHVRHRPSGEFSKGMLRRIGLAQALINDPDLIVLDEPTSGLDPVGSRQVKDLILTLARRGKTVILSSHLLADVENVCSRVAIMCNGTIIVQGGIHDLLEKRKDFRFTVPSMDRELVDKAVSVLAKETGVSPSVDHPMQTLEQFFLERVEDARQSASIQTGVASTEGVAEFLSAKQPAGADLLERMASPQKSRTESADIADKGQSSVQSAQGPVSDSGKLAEDKSAGHSATDDTERINSEEANKKLSRFVVKSRKANHD